MEENEEVKLVAGIINATGKMCYWKDEIKANIGDYAIVENMNGFDLIRVVGTVTTEKKFAKRFSNTNYEDMKKVLVKMSKTYLED